MFEDRSANPLIYLIHIQKTSGTSLRAYFRRGFGAEQCLFHAPDQTVEKQVDLLAIAASNPDCFGDYRVMGGHIGFGKIPQAILERSPVFVSALRDPVARVMSHYQHIRSGLSGQGPRNRLVELTLFQALQLPFFRALADRMQIEYLCGGKELDTLHKEMGQHKYIIGKQEHSQDLFDYLSSAFGIRTFRDLRVNIGSPGYEAEIRVQPDYNDAVYLIRNMNNDEYEFYESFGSVWSNFDREILQRQLSI